MRLIKRLLLLSAWLCMLSVAIAVQPPSRIEETVPKELAQRKDIAGMISRLKFLRISADRLGKKHPSRNAVLKQIKDLESRLSAAMDEKNKPTHEEIPTNSVEVTPEQEANVTSWLDEEDVIVPRRDSNAANNEITTDRSPLQGLTKISNKPSEDASASRFIPAFPHLEFEYLTAVGPFPARGLLWGIEYDPVLNYSKIWQWQDHPESNTKKLYWETTGEVRDFEFDSEFESNGAIYATRVTTESSEERLEILRLTASPLPPFDRVSNQEKTIATAKGRFAHRHAIALGADGGLYVAASDSQMNVVDTTMRTDSCTNAVSRIDLHGERLWQIEETPEGTNTDYPIQLLSHRISKRILQAKSFRDHVEIDSIAGESTDPQRITFVMIEPSFSLELYSVFDDFNLLADGPRQKVVQLESSLTRGNGRESAPSGLFIALISESDGMLGTDSNGEPLKNRTNHAQRNRTHR